MDSRPTQVPAGAPGGGGHELADHVGPGPEQHAGGQVVAQVEHAPGVDAALGDLGQGEHGQEHAAARPGAGAATGAPSAAPPAAVAAGRRIGDAAATACPDR